MQQRSKTLAARPKKFTEESNRLCSETGLTVPRRMPHAGSQSLELPCLLDSLRGRRRMTEPSHAENLLHPAISKDILRFNQSECEKSSFSFPFLFFAYFPFIHLRLLLADVKVKKKIFVLVLWWRSQVNVGHFMRYSPLIYKGDEPQRLFLRSYCSKCPCFPFLLFHKYAWPLDSIAVFSSSPSIKAVQYSVNVSYIHLNSVLY